MVGTLNIYSFNKIKMSNIALLARVTIPYIRFPNLILDKTENVGFFTYFSQYPASGNHHSTLHL